MHQKRLGTTGLECLVTLTNMFHLQVNSIAIIGNTENKDKNKKNMSYMIRERYTEKL